MIWYRSLSPALHLSHKDFEQLADPEEDADDDVFTLSQCWNLAADQIHDMLAAVVYFMDIYFVQFKSPPRQGEHGGHQRDDVDARASTLLIKKAGIVFDLRSDMPVEQRLPALREIHGAALRAGVKLPPVAGFEHQLATLVSRLTSERTLRPLWRGASGTVIMNDLFSASEARLHAGIGQLLWLFQYFALKTANESVNESMGGTVDMHAVGRRHLSQRACEEEAFIHWNGPPLVNARPLLHRALNIHFADKLDGDWHFDHRSFGGQRAQFVRGRSVVLARKHEEHCKLPLLSGKCACHTCKPCAHCARMPRCNCA